MIQRVVFVCLQAIVLSLYNRRFDFADEPSIGSKKQVVAQKTTDPDNFFNKLENAGRYMINFIGSERIISELKMIIKILNITL